MMIWAIPAQFQMTDQTMEHNLRVARLLELHKEANLMSDEKMKREVVGARGAPGISFLLDSGSLQFSQG